MDTTGARRLRTLSMSRSIPTRVALVGLTLAAVLTTSACDSGSYAWEMSESDLVGSWTTTSGTGTELVVHADGTFDATAWPNNLNCTGVIAEDMDAVIAAPTNDLSGNWTFQTGTGSDAEGGGLAGLTLQFPTTCTQLSPQAYFRTAEDGTVSMCFPLDGDPDSFSSSRALAMLKAPIAPGAESEACR